MEPTGGPKVKNCPACHGEFPGHLVVCPNDRTMLLTPQKDELIGQILNDRYKVVEEVGRGGMSAVYKGIHELMDRTVAIKVLLPQLVSDQISIKRFQQEAQAASHLQHPNVITVYDYGFVSSGQPYLVMDFLEGESLSDIIKRDQQVSVKRMIPIFMQACEALEHAHQKGVIHRDLKSSNIMLIDFEGKTDFVKVVDFGIAKLMPSSGKQSQNLTQTGEVFGSPIYMSPEQCMAQSLDRRSDIYSMGAMMYESLTGQPPLMGNSIIDTMQLHMTTPPKPLKEMRPDLDIPEALERVVLKALLKKPEQRYQTMQELRDALEGVSRLMDQEQLFAPGAAGKAGGRSPRAAKRAASQTGQSMPNPKMGYDPEKSLAQRKTGTSVEAAKPAPAAPTPTRRSAVRRQKAEPAKAPAAETKPSLLESMKQVDFWKKPSPVVIGAAALVLSGVLAAIFLVANHANLGFLSLQKEEEGTVYYYQEPTKKRGGMMYLWAKDADEEGRGHLVKLDLNNYNIDDRAANTEGVTIGDSWKVSYHKAGDKNILDKATCDEASASDDLRQIYHCIFQMFDILVASKMPDANAMMSFYTPEWSANQFQRLEETWGKEGIKLKVQPNGSHPHKSFIKVEKFDPDQDKASMLVRTSAWISRGPKYMRFELVHKDNKAWLIQKIEEISPNIWETDGQLLEQSEEADEGDEEGDDQGGGDDFGGESF